MAEHSGDRRHVSGFGGSIMQRIVIAVILSGLVAACGQPSQPVTEGGATAPLDYIDAMPIDKNAPPPLAQPKPAAKKDEPEEDREPAAEEKSDAEPARTTTPEPAAPAADAAEATRRANETTATPYVATPPETTPRPD